MGYNLYVYKEFGSSEIDHRFYAKTKREVVGLMKTIMDNFDPAHVDIMSEEKFDQAEKQTCLR